MMKVDLHIHTVASGHAHNTILEYLTMAKKLEMSVIGISDHGPFCPDVTINEAYFRALTRLPRRVDRVLILRGIEANIIDAEGNLDISDKVIERLDYVMAGLHEIKNVKNRGVKKNTAAIVNAIRSGRIDIVTHPFFTKEFSLDIEKISNEACAHNVLLELNVSCLARRKMQKDTLLNLKKMIGIAKKWGKKMIIGSDAHNIWELGDDVPLRKIKNKIGLTNDLIINNNPKKLLDFLEIKESTSDPRAEL
jgi:putative hydrolase